MNPLTQPGRIESVLARSFCDRASPYRWLARSVSASSQLVLDLACGAGAMSRELHRSDRIVVGLDRCEAELAMAAGRGPGPWVQADGLQIPFADDTFDAVTIAMGLSVISPTESLLAETSRVLRPGGVCAMLLPSAVPLAVSDTWLMTQVSWRLKNVLRFPGELQRGMGTMCRTAGLTKVDDSRQRFRYLLSSPADAQVLCEALDLESVSDGQKEAALQACEQRLGSEGVIDVAISLRRVVAIK